MWQLGNFVENKAGNIYILWCVSIVGQVYGIGIAVTPVQIRYVPPWGIGVNGKHMGLPNLG